MSHLTAVAEIMGRDPFGLRADLERFSTDRLASVPERETHDASGLEHLADDILAAYLQTISPETTGADALSLVVVSDGRVRTGR